MEELMGQKVISIGWAGEPEDQLRRPCGYIRTQDGTRLNVLPDDDELREVVVRVRGDSRTMSRIAEIAVEMGGSFELVEPTERVTPEGVAIALDERIESLRALVEARRSK